MTSDLLIEIGCEDLPARYVVPLATALGRGVAYGLLDKGLACEFTSKYSVPVPEQHFRDALAANGRHFLEHADPRVFEGLRIFATPRRIAVLLAAVPARQPDQAVEQIGPALSVALKDGQPTPAALGFARKCGVEFAEIGQKDGKLYFARSVAGRATTELLPEIFEDTLKRMDVLVPKRMRWGSGEETFVRPVQWLLALLGNEVVPLRRFGLEAGRITYGHRFHAPAAITLNAPADYAAQLRSAKVEADVATRKQAIRAQVEAEAAKLGGTARVTEDLLDEVTALVEWPVVISGRIEDRFLQLPPEVIVATVETNQRYFTVFSDSASVPGQMRAEAGYLKPAFITIANIQSSDAAQVIQGNERVVRPRLTDALFFWEQDRRAPLAAYTSKLADVTYQKELGSIAAKADRVGDIAEHALAMVAVQADLVQSVRRAATLAKSDLVTKVVYEFPELQGLMGGYYATASGEPDAVAKAIAEHYRPTQAGGPIPSTLEGRLVALADKLDTLAGIFKIGQKPTASKDPYALRRAALGVLRILIEGELPLNLRDLLQQAWDAQPVAAARDGSVDDAWTFIVERLRGYCADRGATPEQFEAVRALGAAQPLDFVRRLDALRSFAGTPAAASLAAADKRARNILKQAGGAVSMDIVTARFEVEAEGALLRQIELTEAAVKPKLKAGDYAAVLAELAALKEPVDAFFAAVMVMAEDPAVRANRLALLARLDSLCREVADLSLLPG